MPAAPLPDFSMPHLRTLHDEVGEQLNAATRIDDDKNDEAAEDVKEDPRMQLEYSFDFTWTSGAGKKFKGRFTNKVLTLGQKMKVGVVRGRRQAGTPIDCLSPMVIELIYILTWLEESLTHRPPWAQDLQSLHDEELVQAIFDQIAEHERIFHGRTKPAAEG